MTIPRWPTSRAVRDDAMVVGLTQNTHNLLQDHRRRRRLLRPAIIITILPCIYMRVLFTQMCVCVCVWVRELIYTYLSCTRVILVTRYIYYIVRYIIIL